MRFNILPTPKAPVDQRKRWFVYQMMRYHDFVAGLTGLKIICVMGFGIGIAYFVRDNTWFIVSVCIMVIAMQRLFLVVSYFMTKEFFAEMSSAVWDVPVEGSKDHDMRVLMSRVGNYVKFRDREDLYKLMEECYIDLERKEASNEIAKGEVQEKA